MDDHIKVTPDMAPNHKFHIQDLLKQCKVSQKGIDEIKSWLKENNHPELTDKQICCFLISGKNNIQTVKNCIEAYFRVKKGPIFEKLDIDLEENIRAQEVCVYAKLPKRTRDGAAIIFHKLRDFSYSSYNMEPAMRVFFMLCELALIENPPNGFIVIFDMTGMGMMHLTRARLGAIKTFFQYLQEAFPCFLRSVHVMNSASFIDKVIAIIKPFISKEFLKKLHWHYPDETMEEFYKQWLPAECLPSDFGGELDSIEALHEATIKEFRENKEYFKQDEAQRKLFGK